MISPEQIALYESVAHGRPGAPGASRMLNSSGLQGLAAAMALSTHMVMPGRWLPWVWDAQQGRRPPEVANIEHANVVMALVMAQYNHVLAMLGPAANAPFAPLFQADMAHSVHDFCRGFMLGVNLAKRDWAGLHGVAAAALVSISACAEQGASPQGVRPALWPQPAVDEVAAIMTAVRQLHTHVRSPNSLPLPEVHPIEVANADEAWVVVRAALERFHKPFPHAAIALAHQYRDALAPHFLQVLEEVHEHPKAFAGGDCMLHIFAMTLLACWRDKRAYEPLLAIARLPADDLEELYGDIIGEDFGRCLGSVFNGDARPLAALIADEQVSVWLRWGVMAGWCACVMEGDASADEFEAALLAAGAAAAQRLSADDMSDPDDETLLCAIVSQSAAFRPGALVEAARAWYAQGLVDPRSTTLAELEADLATPAAVHLEDMRTRRQSFVTDVAEEIAWWASYTEPDEPAPARNRAPDGHKVGRNDPCYCGSGLKFKKCHGAN